MKIKASALATIARDIVGCSGLLLIVAGVHQIYAPAALIVAGMGAVAGAVQQARRA